MAKWSPKLTCHDCAGPRYHDTIRCAYHGLRHQWKSKGIDLPPAVGAMWNGQVLWGSPKLPRIKL